MSNRPDPATDLHLLLQLVSITAAGLHFLGTKGWSNAEHRTGHRTVRAFQVLRAQHSSRACQGHENVYRILTKTFLIEVLGLNSRRSRAWLNGTGDSSGTAAVCVVSVAATLALLHKGRDCGAADTSGCTCWAGTSSDCLIGNCMVQARHARMPLRHICIATRSTLWLLNAR